MPVREGIPISVARCVTVPIAGMSEYTCQVCQGTQGAPGGRASVAPAVLPIRSGRRHSCISNCQVGSVWLHTLASHLTPYSSYTLTPPSASPLTHYTHSHTHTPQPCIMDDRVHIVLCGKKLALRPVEFCTTCPMVVPMFRITIVRDKNILCHTYDVIFLTKLSLPWRLWRHRPDTNFQVNYRDPKGHCWPSDTRQKAFLITTLNQTSG